MPVSPLDTLLAIKVINLAPGLLPSDRLVGVILIEHYNRRTGRCDPGVERIATLSGLSPRTVMRATWRLEKAGLVRKIRHGGYSNRNRYEPNWQRFAELEAVWRNKLKQKSRSRGTQMSPETGQGGHVDSDKRVTQTFISNQNQLTGSNLNLNRGNQAGRFVPKENGSIPERSRSRNAAATAAERRWSGDLLQHFASTPAIYGDVVAAIDPEMQARATEVEMKRHGDGLRYILGRLRLT
jgi:DNA-binding transcriptional ArsR family regulator